MCAATISNEPQPPCAEFVDQKGPYMYEAQCDRRGEEMTMQILSSTEFKQELAINLGFPDNIVYRHFCIDDGKRPI